VYIKSLLLLIACSTFVAGSNAQNKIASDRSTWLRLMDKTARPVLSSLANGKLKETMPVVLSPKVDNREARKRTSYLEAFGRTLSGIAPWLNLEGSSKEEVDLRNQYREWTLKAIAHAVNPASKDFLTWESGRPLVDASFLRWV
jgi:hypothetical protein